MNREIKVLIVDDSAIVRQTISSILSKEEDIKWAREEKKVEEEL